MFEKTQIQEFRIRGCGEAVRVGGHGRLQTSKQPLCKFGLYADKS